VSKLVVGTKIPLARPVFDDEMKEAALHAMQNERFVLGESVFKFEEEFARYCGTKFAVSTGSGTAALVLSLIALGVGGGEVITSPASFVASANSVIHAGASPRFADIDLQTYTIDPSIVRSRIGEKTRAVLPIHLYGYPARMQELCEIASKKGLAVVEDACQAHGTVYRGKKAGSLGDVGCFSFYPSKNMTVGGDGGMVTTNDESIAECVSSLRDCGRAKGAKYIHDRLGFTERLNTIQAAIGRVQLKRLDAWNQKRREIAARYDDLLSDLGGNVISPPTASSVAAPVYHLYVLRCSQRDDLRKWLDNAGVETGIHYAYPIHLQPVYKDLYRFDERAFPRSEELCKKALSIPMHSQLTKDETMYVSKCIHEYYQLHQR
jgi:perosamine synthetase